MGFATSLASCFRGGSGERRGTRVESYQTDQLKTSAARLWTLDSRQLPPQPSTPLALPRPSTLDSSSGLRAGEFFAVKDVSFELRRGELRTLGRSEKEISKKCLGATKVPDSGRRRHQLLGIIGHNGAGTQAAWQPLGRLPQVAHRVRRRGKARINTTLLKMLNGLIKPDRGTITMRGRVGALIALGAGFNPILTGREPEGWEARRTRRRGSRSGDYRWQPAG